MDKLKDRLLLIPAALIIAAIYLIIKCPIKFLTGISCPGCGMTRAWLSVLRLDFARAFYYHPAWLVPLIWIVSWWFFKGKKPELHKYISILSAAALITVYILRLYFASPVVGIDVKDGLIYKMLAFLTELF